MRHRNRLIQTPTVRMALRICAILGVAVVAARGWMGASTRAPSSGPSGAAATPMTVNALPGQKTWRGGASSLVFGANDTYEYAPNNFETQPLIQEQVKRAGITVIRTFIADPSTDVEIDQRVGAIERAGALCLVVLTNIDDLAFNTHLVRYLGPRCLMYEFGNEPDYNNITVDDYVAAWNAEIPALRAINPQARFFGPAVSYAGAYLDDFLTRVKQSGVLPDAVTLHWYPCYDASEQACLAQAGDIYNVVTSVRAEIQQILGKDLPIGVTEWNYDPGAPPPAYGNDASFIVPFTETAITAMIRAGVSLACQFDIASYAGYGGLDMIDISTNQPKPQFTTMERLIAQYRPS